MKFRHGRQPVKYLGLFLAILPLSVLSQACRPPSIVEHGHKTMYYYGQDRIRIPCVATGNSSLEYQWTWDGQPVDITTFSSRSNMLYTELGTGTLVIGAPHESYRGYYQCRVTNDCGTSLSVITRLVFGRLEPFRPSPVRTVTVEAGASVVLSCIPPVSIPDATMFWTLMGPRYSNVVMDDRVTMDLNGNLYITNAHLEDEQGGSTYVCGVSNPLLRSLNYGDDKRLRVLGTASRAQRPVTLMWASPSHMTVLKGESATMKCIFAGDPLPTTTWEREDGQLDDPRIYVSHHELSIDRVQPGDSGTYTCSAHNPARPVRLTRQFTLAVESVPEWDSEPTDTTVAVGESAEFECSALGDPAPTIQWFINGQPYQDLPAHPRRSLQGNTLHFSNLVLSDSQVIQCNASNVHGYVWADVYLFVEE